MRIAARSGVSRTPFRYSVSSRAIACADRVGCRRARRAQEARAAFGEPDPLQQRERHAHDEVQRLALGLQIGAQKQLARNVMGPRARASNSSSGKEQAGAFGAGQASTPARP